MTDAPEVVSYQWSIGTSASPTPDLALLSKATSRRYSLRLLAGCDAAFSLDGEDDLGAEIDELATDLHVYRNGVRVFRGRVSNGGDSIGANSHTSSFQAVDYRTLLGRRALISGLTTSYVGVPQASIVWQMVSESQALTGGNWGITRGRWDPGPSRDRAYVYGDSIGELIDQLSRVDNGFDWEIDHNRALNIWSPGRGVEVDEVLAWGSNIELAIITRYPDRYANVAAVVGADGTTPAESVTADLAIDPRGRFERVVSESSILVQATLNARALWMLQRSYTLPEAFSVTLKPGVWRGPSHLGVGDYVRLRINKGRVNVDAIVRVYQIDVSVEDNGVEVVVVTLAREGVLT